MQPDKAIIRHYETADSASRRVIRYDFTVTVGGKDTRVDILFTYPLLASWGIKDIRAAHPLPSRVTITRIIEMLRSALIPSDSRIEEVLSPQNCPQERPYEWKECRFQKQDTAGLICSVAHERDRAKGLTTKSLCEDCGLPSTDILCENLVFPVTVGDEANGDRLKSRKLVSARCNIDSSEFQGAAGCIPGGYSCWSRTVAIPVSEEAVASDMAMELLNLVDLMNLMFKDQFNQELFRITRTRTVRALAEHCPDENTLVSRLQAIGDLIDLMASKNLAEGAGVTADPGSINQLEGFLLNLGAPGYEPVIQTFRDVKTIRTQYSHTGATKNFVDACVRLGIPLPIRDYQAAWDAVLSAMVKALRDLQGLLP